MDEGAFHHVNLCIGDSIPKIFCCEAESTGLLDAEEDIGAGSDACVHG